MESLEGRTVGFIVANEGVEQVELTEPWEAISAGGGTPVLIAPEGGEVQAYRHLDEADRFPVDRTIDEVSGDGLDAIVLPGGVANPDQLRTSARAVEVVREHVERGRPVAVICHGPWTLIEAGVVEGRTLTSWPSLQTDLRNAGATWVDEETVVDANILSSRKPDDLPAFCARMLELFAGDRVAR